MPTRAAGNARSFQALLAAYLGDLQRRRLSASMQRTATRVLPRLFDHLRSEHVHDIRAASYAHVLAFVRFLGSGSLATTSQAHYAAAVRGFFAFLFRRGVLLQNPASALERPRHTTLPRVVFTEAQARRLLAAPQDATPLGRRDRALLEVLYGMGLRLGECRRLGLGDVDLREGQLLVRDGKGRKDRLVPLTARAAEAIDAYLREARPLLARHSMNAALFLTVRGQAPTETAIRDRLRLHARAAGIPGRIFPHALRHTCATHLLRGGADVRHVQELLGHRSIDTTAIYTHVAMNDLRGMIVRCHPRERGPRRKPRKK